MECPESECCPHILLRSHACAHDVVCSVLLVFSMTFLVGDSAAAPAGSAISAKLAAICISILRHQHPIELCLGEEPPSRRTSIILADPRRQPLHSLSRHYYSHRLVTTKHSFGFLKRDAVAVRLGTLVITPISLRNAVRPRRPRQGGRQATRAQSQQ